VGRGDLREREDLGDLQDLGGRPRRSYHAAIIAFPS
jgi:hypothetical protein